MICYSFVTATAGLWHRLPHLVRTTERLVKHGQTMSTVLSVFSCCIMSYCKYDTVSSWEPKHAKTPSPFGVMRYHEIPSLHFDSFQDLNRVSHHLTYLYISYIMFLIFKSCFWEFGSFMVTGSDMWNIVERFYLNEATTHSNLPRYSKVHGDGAAVLCDPMPWLPVLPCPRRGSHCISRKDHQEIINLSTSFNFKPCWNECKFKSHRP